jgi:hypothetical protein
MDRTELNRLHSVLVSMRKNLPNAPVEQRYINVFNQTVDELTAASGVDLTSFMIPVTDLERIPGKTTYDTYGNVTGQQ